jgi:hypothetical protein
MSQITSIDSNTELIINSLNQLSPEQQKEAINFIKFLQQQGQKSNENEPELLTDNSTVKINIHQILGESEAHAEYQGEVIYLLIVEAFNQGKKAILSFDQITFIAWPFIKKAIGQLYEHFPKSQIESNLQLIDISDQHRTLINQVIQTKKEYLQNPAKINEPMSDQELEELRRQNPNNPWWDIAGKYFNDPLFDEMLESIAYNRQQLDGQMAEYYAKMDQEEKLNASANN